MMTINGYVACFIAVLGLNMVDAPAGAAGPAVGAQAPVERAMASLDELSAHVGRLAADLETSRRVGHEPPRRLRLQVDLAQARVRETLEVVHGVKWDAVEPVLDTAFRLLDELAKLDAGLRDWKRHPGSEPPDPDAASSPTGTGAIAGTVTESGTGHPLVGVNVSADCFPGYHHYSAVTVADGSYTIPGLGTATCYLYTNTNSHIDELYDDIPCSSCYYSSGTPVPAVDGTTTSGIDFDLDPYGAVTGRVTDVGTGAGVAGVQVGVYDWSGYLQAYATTDANGDYRVDTLWPGTYFAVTSAVDYADEVFDDIPCEEACDERVGTPIRVLSGQVVTDIDFALRRAGSISGTVVDEETGLPPNYEYHYYQVYVYNADSELVSTDYVDSAGAYEVRGLPEGTYFVRSSNYYGGYRDELYDDIPCEPSCSVLSGTPVEVMWGAGTSGIDFALGRLGTIEGHVADALNGFPLAATIRLYDATGGYVGYSTSDSSGDYFTGALADGDYYVSAIHEIYVDELFDDLPCEGGCDPTAGGQATVATGHPAAQIDFELSLGGWFTGTVTAERDGSPLGGTEVAVYDSGGDPVGTSTTNKRGRFTVKDLPSGTYYAVAGPSAWAYQPDWVRELYLELSCTGWCDVTIGTPITVTAGNGTGGIDFTLTRLGMISGRLTDEATGAAITGGYVDVYDSVGQRVRSDGVDGSGRYAVSGLQAGTYFVRTDAHYGTYVSELWENILCLTSCDVTTGTPITVELDGEVSGIDFALTRLGRISGTVTDSATGSLLPNVRVLLYSEAGSWIASDYTDATGRYEMAPRSTSETYFVATQNSADYLDELYLDIPCETQCNVLAGTPVTVALGSQTTGIDFALQPLGSITGRVTDLATGQGVAPSYYGFVVAYDAGGAQVRSVQPDTTGQYVLTGLPAGLYFVSTSGWWDYLDELFDDIQCEPQCDVAAGTAVAVVLGQATPGIDFALNRPGTITGRVSDAAATAALGGVRVVAKNVSSAVTWNGYTDSMGQFSIAGLPGGAYRVWTSGTGDYVDELYNNIPCESDCGNRKGTEVVVGLGTVTAGIDFALMPEGSISGRILDAQAGFGIPASVRVYDTAGHLVEQQAAEADGDYVVRGLPAGSYYAVTSNSNGYLDELYDDIPCEPSCTVTAGRAIAVTQSVRTTGVDFALERAGAISGRVTNEVTGGGVSSGYVRVYDASANQVAYANPRSDGSYFISPVLKGTYFVRFEPWYGYIGELYHNIPCQSGCKILRGTPVGVDLGRVTGGIDFALAPYSP